MTDGGTNMHLEKFVGLLRRPVWVDNGCPSWLSPQYHDHDPDTSTRMTVYTQESTAGHNREFITGGRDDSRNRCQRPPFPPVGYQRAEHRRGRRGRVRRDAYLESS